MARRLVGGGEKFVNSIRAQVKRRMRRVLHRISRRQEWRRKRRQAFVLQKRGQMIRQKVDELRKLTAVRSRAKDALVKLQTQAQQVGEKWTSLRTGALKSTWDALSRDYADAKEKLNGIAQRIKTERQM